MFFPWCVWWRETSVCGGIVFPRYLFCPPLGEFSNIFPHSGIYNTDASALSGAFRMILPVMKADPHSKGLPAFRRGFPSFIHSESSGKFTPATFTPRSSPHSSFFFLSPSTWEPGFFHHVDFFPAKSPRFFGARLLRFFPHLPPPSFPIGPDVSRRRACNGLHHVFYPSLSFPPAFFPAQWMISLDFDARYVD